MLWIPTTFQTSEGRLHRLTSSTTGLDQNQLWYGFIKEELLWLIIRSVVKWKGHNVTLTDEPTEECVVWPGQKNASEMCMYSSLREVNKGNPYGIRLVKCSRSDLQWWSCFPPTWNGISNKVS